MGVRETFLRVIVAQKLVFEEFLSIKCQSYIATDYNDNETEWCGGNFAGGCVTATKCAVTSRLGR